MALRLKRVYDSPAPEDGYRVLVDRLWPRGISRERAAIDDWMKDIAPSNDLRSWYGHDPLRWPEFRLRYREELAAHGRLLDELKQRMAAGNITLLCAAKDMERSNAAALKELLEGN